MLYIYLNHIFFDTGFFEAGCHLSFSFYFLFNNKQNFINYVRDPNNPSSLKKMSGNLNLFGTVCVEVIKFDTIFHRTWRRNMFKKNVAWFRITFQT